MKHLFKEIKHDLPASIVVFFVALPLCLGIALASGAPLFAGIIAGIIGGIVVGIASGSPFSDADRENNGTLAQKNLVPLFFLVYSHRIL